MSQTDLTEEHSDQGLQFFKNQLLQLRMAFTVCSDLVIRPVLVCSGKCTNQIVTNEKQRKHELTNN